jgi:hypothetical protein
MIALFKRIWPVCIIGLVVGIFFFNFFYPHPKILATQDIGRSDAWHFSFPTKYILGESLKAAKLPLWRDDIGDGFPLFAEGQTGALFLPNTLLFRFVDPVIAYSLIEALCFFMLASGIFWICRQLGLSQLSGVFAGLTLAFSAYPVMQLPHITLLQGTSIGIWVLGTVLCMAKRGAYPWIYIGAFLLSQQVFAGFPQATFLTVLVSACYILWICIQEKRWQPMVWFASMFLLGVAMSAAQLLPSYEFLQESAFPSGFDYQRATLFSFPLGDLATLINPFAIGNPKFATYNDALLIAGNIVWENTMYMGIIPLLFAIVGLAQRKQYKSAIFFIIIGLGSLVLAWGKYSPIYFLYTLWPFNLFRVPSRFIWLTIISIALLSAFGLDWIQKRYKKPIATALLIALIAFNTTHLLSVWWSYHKLVDAKTWLTKPEISKQFVPGRVTTIGENTIQQPIFANAGWVDEQPFFALRSGISPLSNMLWDIPQHGLYAARFLLRSALMEDLFSRQSIDTTRTAATFSATANTLLNLFATPNVISFIPLMNSGLIQTSIDTQQDITVRTYRNPDALPRVYIVDHAVVAATFEELGTILQSDTFSPKTTVILEQHEVDHHPEIAAFTQQGTPFLPSAGTATIAEQTHTSITVHTNTQQDGLLVLADTHYPGWEAFVDGKATPILAANFYQRALVIPQGEHTITFSYTPKSVQWGVGISIGATFLTIVLAIVHAVFVHAHTDQKGRQRQKRP